MVYHFPCPPARYKRLLLNLHHYHFKRSFLYFKVNQKGLTLFWSNEKLENVTSYDLVWKISYYLSYSCGLGKDGLLFLCYLCLIIKLLFGYSFLPCSYWASSTLIILFSIGISKISYIKASIFSIWNICELIKNMLGPNYWVKILD